MPNLIKFLRLLDRDLMARDAVAPDLVAVAV